eukprot:4857784-Lingulodinium_polyedra.AAC.1
MMLSDAVFQCLAEHVRSRASATYVVHEGLEAYWLAGRPGAHHDGVVDQIERVALGRRLAAL